MIYFPSYLRVLRVWFVLFSLAIFGCTPSQSEAAEKECQDLVIHGAGKYKFKKSAIQNWLSVGAPTSGIYAIEVYFFVPDNIPEVKPSEIKVARLMPSIKSAPIESCDYFSGEHRVCVKSIPEFGLQLGVEFLSHDVDNAKLKTALLAEYASHSVICKKVSAWSED